MFAYGIGISRFDPHAAVLFGMLALSLSLWAVSLDRSLCCDLFLRLLEDENGRVGDEQSLRTKCGL